MPDKAAQPHAANVHEGAQEGQCHNRCLLPFSQRGKEEDHPQQASNQCLPKEMGVTGLDEEWGTNPDLGGLTELTNVQLLLGTKLAMVHLGHGHVRSQAGHHVSIGQPNGRCRLYAGGQGAQANTKKEQGTEHLGAER